jgi:hypothetical protein
MTGKRLNPLRLLRKKKKRRLEDNKSKVSGRKERKALYRSSYMKKIESNNGDN